jgi:hypothetical protein
VEWGRSVDLPIHSGRAKVAAAAVEEDGSFSAIYALAAELSCHFRLFLSFVIPCMVYEVKYSLLLAFMSLRCLHRNLAGLRNLLDRPIYS